MSFWTNLNTLLVSVPADASTVFSTCTWTSVLSVPTDESTSLALLISVPTDASTDFAICAWHSLLSVPRDDESTSVSETCVIDKPFKENVKCYKQEKCNIF